MVVESTQLEGCHDAVVPSRVGVPEDVERGNAVIVLPEVRLRCMIGHELLAKLRHGERPAMFEACNELAIGSEEQVLPFPLKVVFGELIHHIQ